MFHGRRAASVVTTVAICAAKLIGGWIASGEPLHALAPVLWISGWLVAVLVWGEVSRHRHAYLEQVRQRAVDAERNREELAHRRAVEERLRIARELHDSLTHAISVVTVQSSVALHLLERRPELVRPALAAINEAGQEAMRELRGTLGVLRAVDGDETPPGPARLPLLAKRFERSGLTVRLHVTGEPRPVPADTGHAVYRIAQEALTNVARHTADAPAPVTVDLTLVHHPARLELRVEDDGPGVPDGAPVPEGHGLRGMRERAAALGGSLDTGPRPGGGFRVHATLPLDEAGSPAPAAVDAAGQVA
ncbi:sensor histidine kinase [Rhizomonospora bruguierae]|uniref:sensor histidine kinase n=1 Tax=Rhizomonospora bruguierae TaxID=1581705 RepID=UPI001BCC7604|nr:sensor histidine kinase [Micromonospora sp. NBRC 107566]